MGDPPYVERRSLTAEQLTSSCRAKLDWADEHLATLYRETDAWGDQNPLTIKRGSNSDGSEHVFTVHFREPPDVWRWALTLGDALHNLRGALDHVIYALAIAQTKKSPPEGETKLAFPIANKPELFEKQRHRIASLNPQTQAAIERLQPYHRLKPDKWFAPLWYLSELNNIDKHRLPHLTGMAVNPNDIAVGADEGTFQAQWNMGHLEDGAPFLRLLLSKPDPSVYVDLKATGAVVMQLEGVPPVGVHSVTKHIRREVHVACRYLWPFLST
jgi:hypothetical protein